MEAVRAQLASQGEDLIRCHLTTRSSGPLDELAGRHIKGIRGLIGSMVLDETAADNLTQEAFLRAFRSLSSFDDRAEFSTWLHRIAMNTVYSHLERQGRSPVVFRSELPESAVDSSAAKPDIEQDELNRDIETAIAALSPKLRAAIVLTCLQGKSVSEAAQIEGCAIATM